MQYDLQQLNKEGLKQKKTTQTKTTQKTQIQENNLQPNIFWLKRSNCVVKLPFVSVVPKVDIALLVSPGCTQDTLIFWTVGQRDGLYSVVVSNRVFF